MRLYDERKYLLLSYVFTDGINSFQAKLKSKNIVQLIHIESYLVVMTNKRPFVDVFLEPNSNSLFPAYNALPLISSFLVHKNRRSNVILLIIYATM